MYGVGYGLVFFWEGNVPSNSCYLSLATTYNQSSLQMSVRLTFCFVLTWLLLLMWLVAIFIRCSCFFLHYYYFHCLFSTFFSECLLSTWVLSDCYVSSLNGFRSRKKPRGVSITIVIRFSVFFYSFEICVITTKFCFVLQTNFQLFYFAMRRRGKGMSFKFLLSLEISWR